MSWQLLVQFLQVECYLCCFQPYWGRICLSITRKIDVKVNFKVMHGEVIHNVTFNTSHTFRNLQSENNTGGFIIYLLVPLPQPFHLERILRFQDTSAIPPAMNTQISILLSNFYYFVRLLLIYWKINIIESTPRPCYLLHT